MTIPAGPGIFGMINRHSPAVVNGEISTAFKTTVGAQVEAIIYAVSVGSKHVGGLYVHVTRKIIHGNCFLCGIGARWVECDECYVVIISIRESVGRILYRGRIPVPKIPRPSCCVKTRI